MLRDSDVAAKLAAAAERRKAVRILSGHPSVWQQPFICGHPTAACGVLSCWVHVLSQKERQKQGPAA